MNEKHYDLPEEKRECLGMNISLFFEDYEEDDNLAQEIDQVCYGCELRAECLRFGKETSSYGVFGGVYLFKGKYSKTFNRHKTEEEKSYSQSFLNSV